MTFRQFRYKLQKHNLARRSVSVEPWHFSADRVTTAVNVRSSQRALWGQWRRSARNCRQSCARFLHDFRRLWRWSPSSSTVTACGTDRALLRGQMQLEAADAVQTT